MFYKVSVRSDIDATGTYVGYGDSMRIALLTGVTSPQISQLIKACPAKPLKGEAGFAGRRTGLARQAASRLWD